MPAWAELSSHNNIITTKREFVEQSTNLLFYLKYLSYLISLSKTYRAADSTVSNTAMTDMPYLPMSFNSFKTSSAATVSD